MVSYLVRFPLMAMLVRHELGQLKDEFDDRYLDFAERVVADAVHEFHVSTMLSIIASTMEDRRAGAAEEIWKIADRIGDYGGLSGRQES